MSELGRLISAEIRQRGPMPFDRFMELALYHPAHGYYRRGRARPRTGREGDFFTSVSVGPLFGCLLARQFLEMWERLGRPSPFRIVEQGAEDGRLACDILGWIREETPAFLESVTYAIVEPDANARVCQEKNLNEAQVAAKAAWFDSIAPLAQQKPVGIFFSNELVDAFPVHRVIFRNGGWRELRVNAGENAAFAWNEKPLSDARLADELKALPLPAIEGYATEIHLRARDWMEEAGRALSRGYLLTIDYGFPASIYYAPFRVNGTLSGYRDHRRVENILADPGGVDLTAHVDFTGLARAGAKAGLVPLGFLDQQHFLTGIAAAELGGAEGPRTGVAENVRAWSTLTRPEYLGARFQVLLQAKDGPGDLAGLRFARPGGLD